MIINNIVDGQKSGLTGIKYFLTWKGGKQEGSLSNLRYAEVHPQVPFDLTVLGQPATFTVSLQNLTSNRICVSAYWGTTLALAESVIEESAKAKASTEY